jgi:hypothetical protein
MNDETKITIVINFALFLLILLLGYYKKCNFTVNSLILIFYSTIFYYLILNKGDGGSSFYWIFLLWIATLIHFVFLLLKFCIATWHNKN